MPPVPKVKIEEFNCGRCFCFEPIQEAMLERKFGFGLDEELGICAGYCVRHSPTDKGDRLVNLDGRCGEWINEHGETVTELLRRETWRR